MTDWLTYEWEWQEQRAVFRVDMQYWNLLPVLSYAQLVFVSAAPKNAASLHFSQSELYRFSQLRRKLTEQLEGRAIFVGSVNTDNLRCLYFYTAENDLVQFVSALCRESRGIALTCGHTGEPHFATYYKLLYPDDAKLQSLENAAYIEAQRKKGAELTLIRRVTLNLAFLNREDRRSFLEEAPRAGFTPGLCFPGDASTHPCCCSVSGFSSLALPELNRFTARAIHLAAPLEGLIESLSAAFIPRFG